MAVSTSLSPSSPAASGAATTSRFLTHCRGRTARTSARATPRSGVADAPTVPSLTIDGDPPTGVGGSDCSAGARGRPAAREAGRLPELARHPQPGGWRRRALPRVHGHRVGRARRPGHDLLRRPRRRPARGGRRGHPLCPSRTKMSVYLEGMRALRRGDLGDPDVVVDVQNGLPFFSRLVTRKPVVVLVHHVHREQWPVVYPGLTGRVGWFIERRVAPRFYRRCQYVAVRAPPAASCSPSASGDRGSRSCTTGPTRSCCRSREASRRRLSWRSSAGWSAQAGRARHRRRPGPPSDPPRTAAARRGRRLVGGQAARVRAGQGRRGHGRLRGARRRGPQARGLRASLAARAALAQGGVGAGGGRGRDARHADGGLPGCGRDPGSVVDGFSGVLVADRAGFATAIGDLLTDDEGRERLGGAPG